MANQKKPDVSFDDIIQEGRRKRKNEELAQQIFGKNRRQSAPTAGNKKAPLGGSLASRVGVTKQRTSSVPRSGTSTPRNARGPTRPPARDSRIQSAADIPTRDIGADIRGSGAKPRVATNANGGGSISIRGAAGGPYVVIASNFAPGTTAADIESVMRGVGGEILYCRLVASQPTVMAEMSFPELVNADKVIATFNNKKADGRLLHVYMKDGSTNAKAIPQQPVEPVEPPAPIVIEDTMEVDEVAESREAEDRLREERRGRERDERDRRESYPAGPRGGGRAAYGRDDYYRGGGYQDPRYGYGGGGGYGGRAGYRNGGGYGRGGWR